MVPLVSSLYLPDAQDSYTVQVRRAQSDVAGPATWIELRTVHDGKRWTIHATLDQIEQIAYRLLDDVNERRREQITASMNAQLASLGDMSAALSGVVVVRDTENTEITVTLAEDVEV